jgi:nucleoside-diphosphate-sugar epimerase
MKKILVIGGTRYLGLEFIKLLDESIIQLYVASRKQIDVKRFIKIDRKNQSDMNDLFIENQFDVVIDFINYSSSDSKILLNSIKQQKKVPKLILISTVYTYAMPLELEFNAIFDEASFKPIEFRSPVVDRPEVTYSEGKRNMESYCVEHYSIEKLVILRFPIILGANDYTKRTHFYVDKIKEKLKVNPNTINSKNSYIFSFEAANSIFNFMESEYYGIYNISFNSISESDLIELFCKYHNLSFDTLIDNNIESINTPFTSNFDFIVNSNKYNLLFPITIDFDEALFRELVKI